MASKYNLLIKFYKNIISFPIILHKNYNQTRAFEASFSKFISLVTLFDVYSAFHNVRELLPLNLLSELFLSKFYFFSLNFLPSRLFHDQFIDTIHDIQCFTFIRHGKRPLLSVVFLNLSAGENTSVTSSQ